MFVGSSSAPSSVAVSSLARPDPTFRLEALGDVHDRASFACGQEALDRYFRTQATQDIRRRIANCFVAVEQATEKLAAYYTIASASIPTSDLPAAITKRLPRYPTIPAVRIGHFAVDLRFRGRGLGAALLADAIQRVLLPPPPVFGLLVGTMVTPRTIKPKRSIATTASYSSPVSRARPTLDMLQLAPILKQKIKIKPVPPVIIPEEYSILRVGDIAMYRQRIEVVRQVKSAER